MANVTVELVETDGKTDVEHGEWHAVDSRAAEFSKLANRIRVCNTLEVIVAAASDGCISCRTERKVSGRCSSTWQGMEGNMVLRRWNLGARENDHQQQSGTVTTTQHEVGSSQSCNYSGSISALKLEVAVVKQLELGTAQAHRWESKALTRRHFSNQLPGLLERSLSMYMRMQNCEETLTCFVAAERSALMSLFI